MRACLGPLPLFVGVDSLGPRFDVANEHVYDLYAKRIETGLKSASKGGECDAGARDLNVCLARVVVLLGDIREGLSRHSIDRKLGGHDGTWICRDTRRTTALVARVTGMWRRFIRSIGPRAGSAIPESLVRSFTFQCEPFDQGTDGRGNICMFGILSADGKRCEHEDDGGQRDDECRVIDRGAKCLQL